MEQPNINCNGYRQLSTGEYYHRLVAAESVVRRRLKPGEVIHHKDEDRSNNAPDNIMVFHSNADHTRFHRVKDPKIEQLEDGSWVCVRKEVRKCKSCGRGVTNEATLCRVCYKMPEKISWPVDDELLDSVIELGYTEMGRRLGVSGNAVKKRLKKRGLI